MKCKILPAALLLVLVSGCATQQAVIEQTQPMQERLAGLEQAATTARASDQERFAVIARELDALRGDLRTLSAQIGVQSGLDAHQTEQLASLGQRLDGLAAQAAETASKQAGAAASLDETLRYQSGQLSAQATETAALAKAQADLARRVDGLNASVAEAVALATQENIRLNGREIYSVVLTGDKTLYPINSPELDAGDIAKLDELVTRLDALDQDFHLEIQGHTDNLGTEDYNYELGKARAEVVKRFLYEQRRQSLSRMSAMSYGAAKPVDAAGNRNRRILVRVLVLK